MAGNPLLGAYITEFYVYIGKEDGSNDKFKVAYMLADNDLKGPIDGTTIITYRFKYMDVQRPFRHIRIKPTKWVGPRPCLRFEAFYF